MRPIRNRLARAAVIAALVVAAFISQATPAFAGDWGGHRWQSTSPDDGGGILFNLASPDDGGGILFRLASPDDGGGVLNP